MDAGEDFATKIVVKTNIVEVLRRELARPSWAGEWVAVGTATDPYQPCEGRYRLTRGALEALRDRPNPVSLVTKSTLVLRDLDVLVELARVTEVTVHFTVTSLDPAVWRAVEPGTPPPWQRLRVMRRLVEAGVPCTVFLAPILPGITDSAESVESVVRAAKEHGARDVWASPLRLVPLVKEHYLGFVGGAFPDLLPRYERAYPGASAPADYRAALDRRVARVRAAHGFADEAPKPAPARPPESRGAVQSCASHQLALAL